MTDGGWFWCLTHARAESPPDVREEKRLGPFPTRAAAENWRATVQARNEQEDREREE